MKIKLNENEIEIENNKTIAELFKKEIEKNDTIIACNCNNEIYALDYIPKEDDNITFITVTEKPGRKTYVRGLLYIMSKAFNECYPDAVLSVNYQLINSMYCEIENMEVTEEMIENVYTRMLEIIDKNLPITQKVLTKEEAIELYMNERQTRGMLQLDNKQKEQISLYYCEDYYNYFYGIMPINTGFIHVFDLEKYGKGFLIRYPDNTDPYTIKKDEASKKLEKALNEYEDIHRILNINTIYRLNTLVREGRAAEVVLLAEALHEKKISDIADDIIKKNGVRVILIAGPSSSGKTTFAKRLGIQLRLNGLKPVTISVDDYFVEREQTPLDENGKYDFERIDAIDLKLFNEHLITLLNGGEILCPTFNFKTGHKEYKGNKMKLADDEILVIEGIHCLNDKLTSTIPKENKYKVYISALTVLNIDYYNRISTTDSRLIRRMVRDNNFRSYGAIYTLQTWDSVNRGENNYIYPYQDEADSIFNTSLIYETSVLKKHLLPLLKEIDNSYIENIEAKRLCDFLEYFEDIDDKLVPTNSLLREFIGGSVFEY